MLAQSCSVMGVKIMKYTMEQPMAWMSCFAMEQFGKRMVIEYHSDILMCSPGL